MKKILVFVLACVIAVGVMIYREIDEAFEDLRNGGCWGDYDFGSFDADESSAPVSVDTDEASAPVADTSAVTEAYTEAVTEAADSALIVYGEDYYSVDDVAYYLAEYDELPPNYITKKEAEALGWISSEGNLWDVAPGAVIGGDRFGNYEGLLPKSGSYTECDVNYNGGYRDGERLVFDTDGNIWYTADHYESFELLYEED